MIIRMIKRLRHLRFFFRPGVWRYFRECARYLIEDHLDAWSKLKPQPHSMVHPSVSFRSGQNVELADYTRVQPNCVLWASPKSKIKIGEHTGLGPGTMIFSSNHEFQPGIPYHLQPWKEADVVIGSDVLVGAGSVIVAGVTIGSCSVVAAGSVVTRDIPPGSVAAGIPAKVIKARD